MPRHEHHGYQVLERIYGVRSYVRGSTQVPRSRPVGCTCNEGLIELFIHSVGLFSRARANCHHPAG